jgi:hypothetical protein
LSDWWESAPVVQSSGGGGDWWKDAPLVGGAKKTTGVMDDPGGGLAFMNAFPIVGPGIIKAGSAIDAALGSGGTLGERYSTEVAKNQKLISDFEAAHPVASKVAEGAGAVAGSVPLIMAAPAAFGVSEAPLAANMAVGAATGAGMGATDAAIRGGDVGEAAKFGAIGGAAGPALGTAAGKVVGALSQRGGPQVAREMTPSTEDLFEAASNAYHDPALKELSIRPSALRTWKDQTALSLNEEGFVDVLAPKTFGVLSQFDKAPANSTVTGQGLNTIRKMLGRLARGSDDTERAAASHAIEALDNFTGNLPKESVLRGDPGRVAAALEDARGNYAAAKRAKLIEDEAAKAARQAESGGSGMNADNALRQRIKSILNNDRRRRGFSADEIDQMERIVKGTPVANISRRIANMLGGGGGLGATAAAAAGAAAEGPIGATLPIVGYGLKRLSAALSKADVESLQTMIRSNSPLGRQIQSSMQKWGKASISANGAPTARNIAALTLASTNLARNLSSAGIGLSRDDLLAASPDRNKRQ